MFLSNAVFNCILLFKICNLYEDQMYILQFITNILLLFFVIQVYETTSGDGFLQMQVLIALLLETETTQ